ncbi:MAG TPA: hypothetical protein VFM34_06915 [Moraxellaceae bacterium]|nr:hypothetical protein [Moraxellaceae bacterium]
MTPPLSKPLQALLLVAMVASIILALRPELPAADAAADLLPPARPARPASATAGVTFGDGRALVAPPGLSNQGYAPPPPPPPPVTAPVVVKPTAPPLPFNYLGKMVRDGEVVVFLGQGENVEALSRGDEVNEVWRLESIGEQALQFRYLPLNETRQLATSK